MSRPQRSSIKRKVTQIEANGSFRPQNSPISTIQKMNWTAPVGGPYTRV
jgi:hypothetical protein